MFLFVNEDDFIDLRLFDTFFFIILLHPFHLFQRHFIGNILSHPLPFAFYAPGSNDRGHIVLFCLFVCLSVCLLSTLTFAITFRDRDFIFGMHTPLMTPFQMTPMSMTL